MEPKAQADSLAEFVKVRSRLFGIAYRMLGSAAEAEDIVQDVWLRWQVTNRSVVLDPPAFASDVVSYSDGGGLVRAARTPIAGRERVAKFITAFASHFWSGATLTWIQTNGQSSVLISRDGAVVTVATIAASELGIDQILWMMRPSKLSAISKPSENEINDDSQGL